MCVSVLCMTQRAGKREREKENDWDELYIIELHCDRAEPSPHTPYRLVMNVVLSSTDRFQPSKQTLRQGSEKQEQVSSSSGKQAILEWRSSLCHNC